MWINLVHTIDPIIMYENIQSDCLRVQEPRLMPEDLFMASLRYARILARLLLPQPQQR